MRFLLYLAIAYFLWMVIRVILRSISSSRRRDEDPLANAPPQKPVEKFKDVQDAEFEDLPPDDKK
jgi:hypothetical protein